MSIRFLEDDSLISACPDFTFRKHVIPVWVFLIGLFVCVSCILGIYLLFPEYNQLHIVFSIGLIVILFCAAYYIDSKYNNLINAVEFQNALFSGAARLATEFCLIVRHDGKIVYIDPEYDHNVFRLKNNNMRSLNILFDAGEVSQESRDILLYALASGGSEKVPYKLPNTPRKARPLTLTLDPINIPVEDSGATLTLSVSPLSRPSGYSLLRVQKELFKKNYDEYIDNFTVGFYSVKNSGEFSFVNNYFSKILGFNEGEIIADKINISDLVFDQEVAKIMRATRDDLQNVVVMRSHNNTPIHVFINQSTVTGLDGKIIGRQAMVLPLSSTVVNDEDKISAKSHKSADILKYSPIATALIDKNGNVTDSNKPFLDVTNLNLNKNINIFTMLSKDHQDGVKQFFYDVLTGKNDGAKPIDISIKIPGKEDKAASLYLNRITDIYGQLQNIIVHMIDTTEMKNLELRFVHSQKMQAIGQLAGGIAHDFNNLLTAIMGFCDLLLMRHPAGDQSFADIMQVKQNANRAANLVKQLLAFSRKQTLQPEIINITDSLADLSNLIGRLIGENITLKMVHGRDLKYIKVDQVQLEQVIINLAVNARDAMPEGGTLTISTRNIVVDEKHRLSPTLIQPAEDEAIENGEYVLIEVSDTGTGISQKIIGKIFEPFFSTKAIGSGTGLGLSTVYGIVKQTGGYIFISSIIGKGSKFSIFLKSYENNGVAHQLNVKTKEELDREEVFLEGSGHILLVEDETPVRMFSNKALSNKGYTVVDANCAEAALDIMKEHGQQIDIIITDVMMPGMSGPDMIKKISVDYPAIKVIFISGYGEDAFRETYGAERSFNFLSKPYSLKQLVMKVKEVLEGGN
jgi:two-component system cell cycle sensor histidine kinase/response regulator CckA